MGFAAAAVCSGSQPAVTLISTLPSTSRPFLKMTLLYRYRVSKMPSIDQYCTGIEHISGLPHLTTYQFTLFIYSAICHTGFHTGWIFWDDEDTRNRNRYSGQLPDGWYNGRDTRIYYCCRSDGHATNSIILPTDSPFVLLKSNSHLCQYVRGMNVRSEYFFWDCEDSSTRNTHGGFKPYSDVGKDIFIHYCYYYR